MLQASQVFISYDIARINISILLIFLANLFERIYVKCGEIFGEFYVASYVINKVLGISVFILS